MSDNKSLTFTSKTDLTPSEIIRVEQFEEMGAPGFSLTDTGRIAKMMDLYLSGKTYHQIASIFMIKKDVVMLYSYKLKWYDLKLQYIEELNRLMQDRVIQAKLQSQDFLLQLTHMWEKKIGKKIRKYLQTENDADSNDIDLKEVDKYLKTIETLERLAAENKKNPSLKPPAVGLNVGDGVTITKTGENSVEITPKQKTIGDMLEILANKRREEMNKDSNDINQESTQNEGEQGNEKY